MGGPEITRIAHIALVVDDATEAELFFEEAFDFVTFERRIGDRAQAELYGVPDARIRETVMELDAQRISLLSFDAPGAPYPRGSTSSDLWFQHFAIIVSDMDAAYAQLKATRRFTPISEDGPIRLPASSGGATAFKFRDGDGHPLELLAFPPNGGPEHWARRRGDALFLGIDHTAISVSDMARSIDFFERAFGLTVGSRSENVGIEQARLDAVGEARVTVSGLLPKTAPPRLELLGYHVGSRRPIPGETTSRSLAATQVVLDTHDLAAVVDALERINARFVSPGIVTQADGNGAIMVLDPDGHRFVVRQT